jgi:light-regulated signal transduction histidine kinase (bacteriophytochrome)
MLDPAPDVKSSRSTTPEELNLFYRNMSTGLHALAQPLTILRSSVAVCISPDITEPDRRHYLSLSIDQVERACNLFQLLQQMLLLSRSDANCVPVDPSQLFTQAVEAHEVELQRSGIEIRGALPDDLPPMLCDEDRTRCALSATLGIAALVSSPGDLLEFLVTFRNGHVQWNVQNRSLRGLRLSSHESLTLKLAEANIRSQQGRYEYTEEPFRVSIALPAQGSRW